MAVLLSLVVATACTGEGEPGPSAGPDLPTPPATIAAEELDRFERIVCELPRRHMLRLWRGVHPERSGEIQMVPEEPHFIGAWLSHSGPWDYVQRIPLFLYGPGHVPAAGRVDRPVTVADLAPTVAEHLRFDSSVRDGRPLTEAASVSDRPPRLILVLVWDTVGINVLEEHPDAWPTLRRLIPEGVWYERATVGSSPSVTPSAHATIGTGAFPRRHGLVDLRFRVGGRLRLRDEIDPRSLLMPSLADVYGAGRDPRPVLGMIGPQGALGLIGKGSLHEGGSPHVAVVSKAGRWIPYPGAADHFRFPAYVTEVPGLEEAARRLDLEDGVLDGRWLGEEVLDGPAGIAQTPAFSEYQTRVVEEVIRGEGFGAADPTDLLYVNYRSADAVGHRWSMNSPQMAAVVRSIDDALADLVAILDRDVGPGEWMVAVTADHGSTPSPEVSGAWVIDNRRMQQDIEAAFGEGVVESFRVTQIWMDEDRLGEQGFTLADVADFIAAYTKGQNAPDDEPPPEEAAEDRLFAAAFPSSALESAPCVPGNR